MLAEKPYNQNVTMLSLQQEYSCQGLSGYKTPSIEFAWLNCSQHNPFKLLAEYQLLLQEKSFFENETTHKAMRKTTFLSFTGLNL